ncbi:MAG: hypothetical protein WBO49_00690 [Candidatus Saccharimonas sp.]
MEPRQEAISGGGERAPLNSGEYTLRTPEQMANGEKEQSREQQSEIGGARAEAVQVAMPTLPAPVLPAQPITQVPTSDDDTPVSAGDDDLIEKEWVDKAKKILAQTRDDPFTREREISKLQIEYIRRRYGREIGDSGD